MTNPISTPAEMREALDTALADYTPGIDHAVRFVSIDQVDMLAEFYLHNRALPVAEPLCTWPSCNHTAKGQCRTYSSGQMLAPNDASITATNTPVAEPERPAVGLLRGAREALAMVQAEPEPQAVRVKKLEWEDADEGMCTKWRAAALGGHYELVILDKEDGLFSVNFRWGNPLGFWFIQGEPDQFGPTGPKKFPSIEAAKAAAEADHAARVLSQIDAVSVAQVRAEALREAARECDKLAGDPRMYGAERRRAAGQCAATIRAMIEKEPNE